LSAVPPDAHEYVDLLDSELSDAECKGQIERLIQIKGLKACDWCGGRPLGKTSFYNEIPPAIQCDKPLEYTVYPRGNDD
jgi:hypothetical protein